MLAVTPAMTTVSMGWYNYWRGVCLSGLAFLLSCPLHMAVIAANFAQLDLCPDIREAAVAAVEDARDSDVSASDMIKRQDVRISSSAVHASMFNFVPANGMAHHESHHLSPSGVFWHHLTPTIGKMIIAYY